jgi:hypothetical protein
MKLQPSLTDALHELCEAVNGDDGLPMAMRDIKSAAIAVAACADKIRAERLPSKPCSWSNDANSRSPN